MDIRTYFNQRAAHWDDGEQSVDQIRRMIAFLSDIQEGMSVLDVACGTGAMFEALRERKPSHHSSRSVRKDDRDRCPQSRGGLLV